MPDVDACYNALAPNLPPFVEAYKNKILVSIALRDLYDCHIVYNHLMSLQPGKNGKGLTVEQFIETRKRAKEMEPRLTAKLDKLMRAVNFYSDEFSNEYYAKS